MTSEAPRVLLADDEETFRLSTARLLEQEGFQCDCAQDAQEAGRLLTAEHHALISDIRMPGNMQFEFLREVRAKFPTLPIVLVTGYPSVQTAVESLRLSFMDYLLKPVDWPAFRQAVQQAVKRARVIRTAHEAREEAQRLSTALERFQAAVADTPRAADGQELAWSMDMFVTQSFARMTALAAALRSMTTDLGAAQLGDICRTLECPRQVAYREALECTVEVLEKTKGAFKSKDLGLLRKKIEMLLQQDV